MISNEGVGDAVRDGLRGANHSNSLAIARICNDADRPRPRPHTHEEIVNTFLVHDCIAHWAQVQPQAVALASECEELTFAQLHQRVQAQAAQWGQSACEQAAPTVLLPLHLGVVEGLVQFLAVLASGRCAAIGDAAWPPAIAQSVQAAVAALPPYRAAAPDLMPFYIGFTSGSSGQPKGFRRHHRSWVESFAITAQTFGAQLTGPVLAPGRISHSLFLFAAMLGLWTGRGARVQEKFSAETTWAQLQQAPGSTLVAVPSQLLLLMQMAQRKGWAPLAQPSLVLISGARWMREHTPQLQALVPQARVTEFYGASEASYITWMDVADRAHPQTVGQPFGNVQLRIGPTPHCSLPVGEVGRIWLRSPMLFMDYVHALDGSAAELHDGWLTVRDMGWLDAAGQLYLCGRESRMLVTQGKNLFPEEVEAWLLAQPGVAQVSVIGLPDALRGLRIHAVLHGADLPAATALAAGCRAQLEAFKTPRRWWRWQGAWPQTRSGKTDTAALQAAVAQALAGQPPAALQPWR